MVNTEEYEILDENGKLFCKCRHDEQGNIQMIGKNTSMTLQELQQKAIDPSLSKRMRGKRTLHRAAR